MKRFTPWLVLGVAAPVALFAILLLAGCGSGTAIETSVSVDNRTHQATISYRTGGDWDIAVLFLTYPGGRRQMPLKGNVGSGGANLQTEELSPGNYTFTVYAIPQENRHPRSVPVDEIVGKGLAYTGEFNVR
jgi:hypothetical protein